MSFQLPSQTIGFDDRHPERLRDELLSQYLDLPLRQIPTPAMIINKSVFARNCAEMHRRCKQWGWKFRTHIKTHKVRKEVKCPRILILTVFQFKTVEGTRLQLRSPVDTTHAVVASTLPEVKHLVRGGLVEDGTVKDVRHPSFPTSIFLS